MGGCEKHPFAGNLKVISMAAHVYEIEFILYCHPQPSPKSVSFLTPAYRVEAAKTTAAPLVAKFGVKAGGDYNANRTVPLVFWGLLVPACQMVQFINFAHLVS